MMEMTVTQAATKVSVKPISADSHVTEPPGCYIDHIEKKYRDTAPRIQRRDDGTEMFVIDGMAKPVPLGLISAAGKPAQAAKQELPFSELHRGGWDPKARIADQDRDGLAGEVLYASIGMVLCGHSDPHYKQACFDAYNRWLSEEFVAGAPDRLYGMAQTAILSVDDAVRDFRKFREMGFKGVMMPGEPATDVSYDHPDFDPLWRTAVELGLPIGFHILTTRQDGLSALNEIGKRSGSLSPMIAGWQRGMSLVGAIQNIIAQFIWGGVFERHPGLKMICVEADAGWAPYFAHRMDHVYNGYRHLLGGEKMARLPSDYFFENVYLTFQSDRIAFQTAHLANPHRFLWASDFPHGDSTWPNSLHQIESMTSNLSDELRNMIIRENVMELYGLNG